MMLAAMLLLAQPGLDASAPRSFVDQLAAAKTGDRDAQFAVGEAFRTGTGTTADRDAAIGWYRLAAQQGDDRASAALGVLLFVKGERRTAIPLIEAAAGRGDPRALYVLGTARFNGDGVPKDVAGAYLAMRRAADAGLPQARRSLAIMEPYVTPDDRARAEALRTGTVAAISPAVAPPAATVPRAPLVAAPSPDAAANVPAAPSPRTAAPAMPAAAPTMMGSIAPVRVPGPAPRPAIVAPTIAPPGSWRVQLGAYGTSARAETQWALLAARLPALKPLDHNVQAAGAMWRLQAGGFASRTAADALCREVAGAGGACFVVAP